MRNKVLATLLAATMVAVSAPSLTMAADLTPTVDPSKGTPTVTETTEQTAGGTTTVKTETYDDGSTVTTSVTSMLVSGGETVTVSEVVAIDAATGIKEAYQTTYDANGNLVGEVGLTEAANGSKVLTVSDGVTSETVTQAPGGDAVIQTVNAQGTSAWIGGSVEIGGEVIDADVLGKGALTGNQTLRQAKLDVTKIEAKSANNTNLEEVDISTADEIGKKAFFGSEKLDTFYLKPKFKVSKKAFNKTGKNETFYLVGGSKSDKKAAKVSLKSSGLTKGGFKVKITNSAPQVY